MPVVAIFKSDGTLQLAGRVYTQEPGYDDSASVDDTRQLNDAQQFDEAGELNTLLFDYLCGLIVQQLAVNRVEIDHHGNLIAASVQQNAGGTEFRITNVKAVVVPGTIQESQAL